MTPDFLRWLTGLIEAGDVHPFYVCREWLQVSQQVRRMDRDECQLCKAHGRYRKADLVHHVNHLRRAPALALDIWYTDGDGATAAQLAAHLLWEQAAAGSRPAGGTKHFGGGGE